MKLRITDDRYDNTGTVYDFDSIDSLVEEMMPTLKTWAMEEYNTDCCNVAPEERSSFEEILAGMVEELKGCIEILEDR